ncbi:hypothetical protein FIBSPDRAFT_921787 [Athelia psychrophila]|uniref:Uncharacterized protein n=1 Tax=Athelia psychrophila TaxID=1759441 RepID=A0A166BJW2_9AGAM|nr:hypothetical protein FIBSPDRAFT_921787 [Fibularhizoctonia sp. CBS 109695]
MSTSQNAPAGSSNSNTAKSPSSFEFTKRKKYADLLISELTDAIQLILSLECKVLFCSPAVTELLGWRDEDLIDGDFIELINIEDRGNFKHAYSVSLQNRDTMLCYIRLKCKSHFSTAGSYNAPPKEALFEFKGHPHFIDGEAQCKVFFAAATPYPSRNTAMLNTFLELKMENERLLQRRAELRAQPSSFVSSTSALTSQYGVAALSSIAMAPMSSLSSMAPVSRPYPITIPTPRSDEISQPYYPRATSGAYGASGSGLAQASPLSGSFPGSGHAMGPYAALHNPAHVPEDTSEEGARKKKLKKTHPNEQYVCVTCGRTDSPEWRKGPQGPKTLCNACGLRWAKMQRKTDDDPGTGEGAAS